MHENAYNMLLKKLGIEDLGVMFMMIDPKAVQETLEYEMLRREMSQNAKDTIQLDENGQFPIPFEASTEYTQIKNILYSMVDKSLRTMKMNGAPKTLAPVTLFEKGNRGKGANKALKFYTKADPYMEVMLPHWFRNKFNKTKFPTDESILNYLNSTDEGKSILTGVGFRIPTQAMSSIEVFRVKGFLPQFMGDTIIAPSEITAKAGSDFDIDKMNTYLKSVYVDEKGDVRLVKLRGSEEATKQYYGEVFDNVLEGKKVKKDELLEALQNRQYALEDTKNLEKRYGGLLDSILADVEDPADFENQLTKELEKLGDKNLQEGLKERFVDDMYRRALENEYYASLEKMITLPENFDNLVRPISDGGLKEISNSLDSLRNQDETTIKNRMLNRNYLTTLRHAFVSAKKWVGIVAVNITGHSLAQKTEVYIDPERISAINDFDRKIIGDASIVLPHNTIDIDGKELTSISGKTIKDGKQLISDRLSGYATGAVDVAKDPYLVKITSNEKLLTTAMFLERIGAGENTIWFLNQPIISEYMKYLDSIGSTAMFSAQNIKAIRAKFPTTTSEIKNASIDVNALQDNIKNFYEKGYFKNSTDNAVQHVILQEFLKYNKMAGYSFKLTQATNYDTTKFKTGDSLFKKQTRTAVAREKNIFSSVDKVLNSSFIGKQAYFLDKSMEAMGAILKLEQDEFSIITDSVLTPYAEQEFMSGEDYDRIAAKIKSAFLDYIIQTKLGINAEIKELTIDTTSVADQLAAAKKKFPKIKILNDFQVVSGKTVGGAKSVKINMPTNDAYDIDTYTEMMRELRDNPETRNLYYDLITLSLLQGTYQSANSFRKIIPVEDFAEIVSPIINTLSVTPDVQNFANGAFQKTNWKDDTIVPTLNKLFFITSEAPVNVELDSFGDVVNEIYQYSSPSFPNIEVFGIQSTDRKILLLDEKYNRDIVKSDVFKVPRLITSSVTGETVDMVSGRSMSKIGRAHV